MIDDPFFHLSQFGKWCSAHEEIDYEYQQQLRKEALAALVASVRDGEIISLDGVESPLSLKISEHHGLTSFEMNGNWIGSSQTWVCPCCSRSKFQVSRIGKKDQILAKLVIHHDHMGDALKFEFNEAFKQAGTNTEQIDGLRLIDHMSGAFAAYGEVLVCEDCNNADTEAKKQVSAPSYFSFSIGQIRSFIQSSDHSPHHVDITRAQQIWQDAHPSYRLRMRIIKAVANAAATDSHWYEPHPRQAQPIPVLGYSVYRVNDKKIHQWVTNETLFKALGSQEKRTDATLSGWRTVIPKRSPVPPANFLAMLRSEVACATDWEAVPDDWFCPVCKRSKEETVYIGKKGNVSFYLRGNPRRGSWASIPKICNHCRNTLTSLLYEVRALSRADISSGYDLVSATELSSILTPRAHSSHAIQQAKAFTLVNEIVKRIKFS